MDQTVSMVSMLGEKLHVGEVLEGETSCIQKHSSHEF